MKKAIVALKKPTFDGMGETVVYAIRRTTHGGFLWLTKRFQYLRLVRYADGEWADRDSMHSYRFWRDYTTTSPEEILEVWNYKPLSAHELEDEIHGVVIDPTSIQINVNSLTIESDLDRIYDLEDKFVAGAYDEVNEEILNIDVETINPAHLIAYVIITRLVHQQLPARHSLIAAFHKKYPQYKHIT